MAKPTPRTLALVYNPDKPEARAVWLRLKTWLARRGLALTAGPSVTPAMKRADFIIAVGGDGTVLKTARAVSSWGLPVLGVNVGRLGFLAATDPERMMPTITRVLAGQGRLESRTMISATAKTGGRTVGPYLAVNDCVVRSGDTGRVLRIRVSLRGETLAGYSGDGVIVSTPTGSTAYNLAASGPIVHPDLDVFLLCPICPHSLVQRPLVFPAFEIVTVEVLKPNPSALVSLDGQAVHTLRPGDTVDIRRAAEQVKLLMDPETSYYKVLQSKLRWGGD